MQLSMTEGEWKDSQSRQKREGGGYLKRAHGAGTAARRCLTGLCNTVCAAGCIWRSCCRCCWTMHPHHFVDFAILGDLLQHPFVLLHKHTDTFTFPLDDIQQSNSCLNKPIIQCEDIRFTHVYKIYNNIDLSSDINSQICDQKQQKH